MTNQKVKPLTNSQESDFEGLLEEQPLTAAESYQTLLRSLRRKNGFNLLFVRCSPVQADEIIRGISQVCGVRTYLPRQVPLSQPTLARWRSYQAILVHRL
jgi:hypothetical protein